MPLALIVVAWILIMTGIRGDYAALGQSFSTDVMSKGGFFNFGVGIVGIAAFFRLIGLPNAGRAFLILVIVAYLLQNQNVLTALEQVAAPSASGNAAASGSGSGAGTAAVAS